MGVGQPLRVGLMSPHAAAGPEVELPDMAGSRITVTLARVFSPGDAVEPSPAGPPTAEALRALTRPHVVDAAANRLRAQSVDVVAHASTTTGYALGVRSEAALVERLATRCGVPAVGSASAAAQALRAFAVPRVTLVHPPWFDRELDELGVAYFRQQGFDVVLTKAVTLRDDPSKVSSEDVVDWAKRDLGDDHSAVYLAGNGFRAARAIEELEQRTGRLVLQANQVVLWAMSMITGRPLTITGYGRLFGTRDGDRSAILATHEPPRSR